MTELTHKSNKIKTVTDALYNYTNVLRLQMFQHPEPIPVVGAFLYLKAKNKLTLKQNIDVSFQKYISIMDRDYVNTLHGNISTKWINENIFNTALCYEAEENEQIAAILDKYLAIISHIDRVHTFEFCEVLIKTELTPKECLDIFDSFLIFSNEKLWRSEHSQPKEISELITRIIPSKGESLKIFDPFSGQLSYATYLENYSSYTGIEINKFTWDIGMLRIGMIDLTNKVKSICDDVSHWTSSKYDMIVTTPPFGVKMLMSSDFILKKESSETVALTRFEETTTEKGELVTIVPRSVLLSTSTSIKDLRKELTSKGYLDSIILLPQRIFGNTNICTALIHLRKKRANGTPVKLIDARDQYFEHKRTRTLNIESVMNLYNNFNADMCCNVSIEEIEKNGWSWDISKYQPSQTPNIPDGHTLYSSNMILKHAPIDKTYPEGTGHLVTVSNLSHDILSCYKTPEDFPISDKLKNAGKLTVPAILISSVRNLNPTFCNASEDNPIFLSSSIYAYVFDSKKIHPGFLCLQIDNNKSAFVGIIPRITRDIIDHFSYVIPDLDLPNSHSEQEKLFNIAKETASRAKIKEMGLQETIDKMKAEYINEVRMKKHDMRPYIGQIASTERIMRYYLENKDSETFVSDMNNQLDIYHEALNHLSELLEHLSDENEFGVPEKFNVDSYFHNLYMNQTKNENFRIIYHCDEIALKENGLPYHKQKPGRIEVIPLCINVAHLDFERMTKNIFSNAMKHGFTDKNRDDYFIRIELSVDSEHQMFQIDFINNGNPLPDGLTKERFGLKGERAGITGGTGLGGNIIKRISTHYGGDYNILTDSNYTIVRILLPIMNEYE